MDYEALRQAYPEIISMEQLYKIAHISKRKARWLLKNDVVPCEDNGKKTKRFKIHMDDVIEFLQRQENGELEGVIPVGAFSDGASRDVPVRDYLDSEVLANYLLQLWQDEPDMLTVKQAAALCGYVPTSINCWAQEGRLQAVLYFGNNIVSKESLAEFLASPYGQSIGVQSLRHRELIEECSAEIENSGMTFGVMSL